MKRKRPRSHHLPSVLLVSAALLGVVCLGYGVFYRSWWEIGLALAVLIGAGGAYVSADRQHTRG
jgi:hypothetical protein